MSQAGEKTTDLGSLLRIIQSITEFVAKQLVDTLASSRVQQYLQGFSIHISPLKSLDFSRWRQQFEYLLDVDFHAVVGEAGIAEHHP